MGVAIEVGSQVGSKLAKDKSFRPHVWAILPPPSTAVVVLTLCGLGYVAGVLIFRIEVLTSAFDSNPVSAPVILQLLLATHFAGPLIAGAADAQAALKPRWLAVSSLAPAAALALISTSRTALIIPGLMWLSGYAISKIAARRGIGSLTGRRLAIGAAACVLTICFVLLLAMFREAKRPDQDLGQTVRAYSQSLNLDALGRNWTKYRSAIFGNVYTFSYYLESVLQNPPKPEFGANIFAGPLHLLGVPRGGKPSFEVDSGVTTNAYTVFRPPIDDFGLVGSLGWWALVGLAQGIAFTRLKMGNLGLGVAVAWFYVDQLGVGGTFFRYNSILLGYFLAASYFGRSQFAASIHEGQMRQRNEAQSSPSGGLYGVEGPAGRTTQAKRAMVLTTEYPPVSGGIASYAHALVRLMAEIGWDTTVVTTVPSKREPVSTITTRRVGGQLNRRILKLLPLAFGTWREVFYARPNLMLLMKLSHEGLVGWTVRRLLHTPYVVVVYGSELLESRSGALRTRFVRHLLGDASVVMADSNYARSLALDLAPRARVTVVHPVVELPRLGDRPDRNEKTVTFLTIGRLVRRKGHADALQAFERVIRHVPTARFLIAGSGPEEANLLRLREKLSLHSQVQFLGAVDGHTREELYLRADVFVTLSQQSGNDVEGFGVVFLEAAARSLPVIAGATGGVFDAVEDGVTGFLVDPADHIAVAALMEQLALNDGLRRTMGSAGRRRVETQFSGEARRDQVRCLLDEAVSR